MQHIREPKENEQTHRHARKYTLAQRESYLYIIAESRKPIAPKKFTKLYIPTEFIKLIIQILNKK